MSDTSSTCTPKENAIWDAPPSAIANLDKLNSNEMPNLTLQKEPEREIERLERKNQTNEKQIRTPMKPHQKENNTGNMANKNSQLHAGMRNEQKGKILATFFTFGQETSKTKSTVPRECQTKTANKHCPDLNVNLKSTKSELQNVK